MDKLKITREGLLQYAAWCRRRVVNNTRFGVLGDTVTRAQLAAQAYVLCYAQEQQGLQPDQLLSCAQVAESLAFDGVWVK